MNKAGGSDSKNTRHCTFCGKSQHEVRKLIAGPTVFICNECVELCMDKWPKIPLVSASLKCEVRTADTSSMPKSFAAATCPWLSLQGNDSDDSHLGGVLR